jgi:hypothetical protein
MEEAQFYLEQTNWNLKEALEEWELDSNYDDKGAEVSSTMPKSISKNVTDKKPKIENKDKKKRSKC